MPDSSKPLRAQLLALLRGGNAHVTFEKATAKLPARLRGAKPPGQPHTAWRLLEHMRIAQWDILEFSRNPKHKSPKWPDEYWPAGDAPPNGKAWAESLRAFRRDRRELEKLVADPKSDLFSPFPHGDGQTLLREALLAADHTAYHLGQLLVIRRLLGAWDE
jgi:hypothetical protein